MAEQAEAVEAVLDAAIKAARAEAKKQGLVEKGADLKVVINLAFRSRAYRSWFAYGSKIPAPCPAILKQSLTTSAEEANG